MQGVGRGTKYEKLWVPEKVQGLPNEGQDCFKQLSSKFYLVTDSKVLFSFS
jgi:hypothetical protein